MEGNNYHYHPNSNADYYRSLGPSDRPIVPVTQLQFIAIHEDGHAILGGSNMTDRYWCGRIWFFKNTENLQRDQGQAHPTMNTVCDAAFLDSERFLLAEDGGSLQILTINSSTEAWSNSIQSTTHAPQHYDSITSLAVFGNKSHFVSSGKDLCIKVWQTEEFIPEHSYETAHSHMITGVDVMPKSESVFVSTSMDCEATIWDTRKSTAAQTLIVNKCALMTTAWNPSKENEIAIGAADGSVSLIDTREPGKFLSHSLTFPREVHRIKFHPTRENYLAGCCDDNVVKVIDPTRQLSTVYSDQRHTDIVRGLAWQNDDLLTCSWDDTVLRHNITPNKL